MSTIIAAVDTSTLDTFKNAAMGLSVVSLVVAVVLLKVISGIIGRIVSTVLLVAVALVGYSQRAEITDCITKVKSASSLEAVSDPRCTFFGQEFTVKIPQPSK